MLSYLPCFYALCWSAIPIFCYILNAFYSCSCPFLLTADACLSWSLSSITEQQVPSQASYICSISWRITGFLSLLCDLCACVHRRIRKKWRHKGSHSSSVNSSNLLVWLQTWKNAIGWCTAQWKMLLFCAQTIVKESRKFELACQKKEKKNK